MTEAAAFNTLSTRTDAAVAQALAGERRGIRAILPLAGPAFVASVAYVDPGNFATNIQAGAHYGYGFAVGGVAGQCAGDVVPSDEREAGHRHRAQPGTIVPASISRSRWCW